jgi:succinyl-CoA synthetase beta subunit
LISQAVKFMQTLYSAYESMDASLVEINPFLLTKDNRLIALDAKITFDDNALFRHPDFKKLRDLNEEEPLEIEASKFDLNYIKLDGNIACMVNGAGLAMATMDIIKLAGGNRRTFWTWVAALRRSASKLLFASAGRSGGAGGADKYFWRHRALRHGRARGCGRAPTISASSVPVVVRLEGTNVEEGQRVIRESGLNFTVAYGMKDAAEKVVALAG